MLLLVTKMLNKLISKQDWLAQEVCHHLLDRNLKACSRIFTNIDVRPIDNQTWLVAWLAQGDTISGETYLEKYCTRPLDQAHLTLLYVARYCNSKRGGSFKPRPRAKPRIVKIFPAYFSSPDHPSFENFCRVKMMLHHPFKNPTLTDLMRDPSGLVFDTWQDAYRYYQKRHSDHESDPLDMDNPVKMLDDESETESLDGKDKNLNAGDVQFKELLNQCHPQRDGVVAFNNTEFGQRDIDKNYDWLAAKSYPVDIYNLISHLETQKGATTKAAAPATLEEVRDVKILNPKQRQVFDRVMDHYLSGDTSQLLFHVDGMGGTGKSTCIDTISWHMAYHATQNAGPTKFHDLVIWAAPTGITAYNIQGCTLHSLLRLPVNQPFVDLSTGTLSKLQP